MNLLAEWYGQQPGQNQTNRFQLEVASASFATTCTVALGVWTIYDGFKRLDMGMDRDMELGVPMVLFAGIGLLFNGVSLCLFHMQGIPTQCRGDHGQLNLCAAVMHLIGDTIRMIVILGSGLYITISGSTDSGKIDAWCAILVTVMTFALLLPVVYGLVLTIRGLCRHQGSSVAPGKLDVDDI